MMIDNLSKLDFNQTYTYADYLTWQLKERVELIKGKIFKMAPAPSPGHQSILTSLVSLLYFRLKDSKCKVFPAPFDVRLPDGSNSSDEKTFTVVQPDISVVCDPAKIDEKGCKGPPDLVVEIVSPSSIAKDLHEKYELYENAGIKDYWVIHPNDKSLLQYRLDASGKYQPSKLITSGDILKSEAIPGLEINLQEIFGNIVMEPEEGYGEEYRRL